MKRFSHIDTWVFDLDNTLYDAENGVLPKITEHMNRFVGELLNIPYEEAQALRHYYYKKYGTTLRGLMTEQNVDPHHFLKSTHEVDISDVPQCAITREYLEHLPGRKIVFTNTCRSFATRMTQHLGIDRHFEHVFTIEDAGFMPKPHPDPYHNIIQRFNFDPKRACMFEDTEANLKTAADLGMTTVWIHGKNPDPATEGLSHIHHRTEKLADWLKTHIRKK